MVKIALSASHYQVPQVQALLNDCDLIFTTQVAARDELYDLFGEDRVRFIPCATESMERFLIEETSATSVVRFSDVRAAFREGIRQGTDELLLSHTDYFGWKAEYDPNGALGSGWYWTNSSYSKPHFQAGDESDRVLPAFVRNAMVHNV